jgi:hypothetical protein
MIQTSGEKNGTKIAFIIGESYNSILERRFK